jgi:hypothetical protein
MPFDATFERLVMATIACTSYEEWLAMMRSEGHTVRDRRRLAPPVLTLAVFALGNWPELTGLDRETYSRAFQRVLTDLDGTAVPETVADV